MPLADTERQPIDVLIVDDHPALRAGLTGLLRQEEGFRCLGAVASELEMTRALDRRPADVVVLDYALGHSEGLSACFRIKQRPDAPGVVLYSAYVDGVFAVPAAVAQADAIVPKNAPVEALLDAMAAAAGRTAQLPAPSPELIAAASARLQAGDLPVLGMLFARTPVADIARTLKQSEAEVCARALRIIGVMQASDRIRGPGRTTACHGSAGDG